MRNNEDFRKLVDDKYKSLNIKRAANRRNIITTVSCFLVCILTVGVFFGNGIRFNDSSDANTSQDGNSDIITEDSGKDSLHTDKNNTTDISAEDYSSEQNQSNDSDEVSGDASGDVTEDVSEDVSEDITSDIPQEKPNELPAYPIIPDDFPDITQTVDLLQYLSAKTPTFETSPFGDIDTRNGIGNFSFDLFRNSYEADKNNLLSPTSALYAMAMLTNGADGNTKDQLVNALCGTDLDRLNEYMCEYRVIFGKGEGYNTSLDSAVWYDESVTVDKNFLQKNYDYYGIDAYKTIFGTQDAIDSVNGWISEKTNGLIDKFIEKFEEDTELVLANTLYFEANWCEGLTGRERIFTKKNGEQKNVTLMYGETYSYLENDNCKGFIYSYENRYSLVALLPNEDIGVDGLVNSLNFETYDALLNNRKNESASFWIPKFETNSDIDLKGALIKMGVTDVFDGQSANLNKMAISENGNLYVHKISQKSTISVHEDGTLAAAATMVSEKPDDGPEHLVYLDRPFVYMIIDNTTNLPLFIGTVEDF